MDRIRITKTHTVECLRDGQEFKRRLKAGEILVGGGY